MAIQLFVPRFHVDECLEQIRECLEKGWTGMGFKTLEIEAAWKSYTGLANAHFLSSNTAGLHLALEVFRRRFGWQEEDEVITARIDLGLAQTFRDHVFNFAKHRSPHHYQLIVERTGAGDPLPTAPAN